MIKVLTTISRYSNSNIHPYLIQSLQKNHLWPLNHTQLQTLQLHSANNHLCINAPQRIGKTLAYLVPVLNRVMKTKNSPNMQSGAIIITINKELVLQIYKQIRLLDAQNKLCVRRCGSITHYSPVIEQLCKTRQQQDEEMIINLMDKNVAGSVKWPDTDILISTPETLFRILQAKVSKKERFAPYFIVIDEADLILNKNQTLFNYFKNNIKYLYKLRDKSQNIQYIMSTPYQSLDINQPQLLGLKSNKQITYTNTIQPSIITTLNILTIKLPLTLSLEERQQKKLILLYSLLKNRPSKRMIIFTILKHLDNVKNMIKNKLNVTPLEYYSKLSSEKRMSVVFDFNYKRNNILIATELAARGLTFQSPIDTIISFDPDTQIQEQIIRMGRSNQIAAEYIIMAPQDHALFTNIQSVPHRHSKVTIPNIRQLRIIQDNQTILQNK